MQGFNGFPPGKTAQIRIPSLFFSELLPQIDHLAELKLTLYCFWALQQQEDKYRYIRFSEVLADEDFLQGLSKNPAHQKAVLQEAFERAVTRGTLLAVELIIQGEADTIYFVNTALGRTAVEAIDKGAWLPGDAKRPIQLILERPNIFVLYEQNIGALTPLIADQLRAAESDYPDHWIEEAIGIAVAQNKRHWNYVRAILERWLTEGKRSYGASEKLASQYGDKKGDYSDFFE